MKPGALAALLAVLLGAWPASVSADCSGYATQAAAQQALYNNPADPEDLDPDGNGVACEELGSSAGMDAGGTDGTLSGFFRSYVARQDPGTTFRQVTGTAPGEEPDAEPDSIAGGTALIEDQASSAGGLAQVQRQITPPGTGDAGLR